MRLLLIFPCHKTLFALARGFSCSTSVTRGACQVVSARVTNLRGGMGIVMAGKAMTMLGAACAVAACSANAGPPSIATTLDARPATRAENTCCARRLHHPREPVVQQPLPSDTPAPTRERYGFDQKGDKIALHAQDLSTPWDINHFLGRVRKHVRRHKRKASRHRLQDGRIGTTSTPAVGAPANYCVLLRSGVRSRSVLEDGETGRPRRSDVLASILNSSFVSHQNSKLPRTPSKAADTPTTSWGCEGGRKYNLYLTHVEAVVRSERRALLRRSRRSAAGRYRGRDLAVLHRRDLQHRRPLVVVPGQQEEVYNGPDWKSGTSSIRPRSS